MTVPLIESPAAAPPPEAAAVAVLVEAESEIQQEIEDNLIEALLSLWIAFGEDFSSFYDGTIVQRFATDAARLVRAAQQEAGRITEAYLRDQIDLMGETLPDARLVDLPSDLRMGASVEETYQRPIREVRYLASTDVEPVRAVETARERLERIAETDLQLARTLSAQQVMYRFPQALGWRRIIHPELGRVCGLCIVAADRVYGRIEKMDMHPACIVEGTEVSASDVRLLTRRRYAGPVVVLRTRSGKELRVTPNHPVLTDQGWVSAGRLRVGDRVLRSGFLQRPVRGRPDEQHRPARIEDVWRSLTVSEGLLPRAVPLAPEDLHGDGGDGEVDVVLVDRHLSPVAGVSFFQPCRELSLVGAHGGRVGLASSSPIEQFFLTRHPSSVRSVSALQELKALVRAELAVSNPSRLGSASHGNFSAPESTDDRGTGYAEVGRQLLDRLAGEVEFDDLVEVDVVAWSGHVFNLETGEGWYEASTLVVSNCKCTILPVLQGADPGLKLNADDLTQIYEAAGGTTDGRALSKLRIETKQNGELGPILTAQGTEFKRPKTAQQQLSDFAQRRRREQLQKQVDELRARQRMTDWHQARLEQLESLLEAAAA